MAFQPSVSDFSGLGVGESSKGGKASTFRPSVEDFAGLMDGESDNVAELKPPTSSITDDVLADILEAPSDIIQTAEDIPGELEALGGEIEESPLTAPVRLTGEMGLGALKEVGNLAQLPASALEYLAKKGLVSPTTIAELGATGAIQEGEEGQKRLSGLESLLFGKEQAGDKVAQSIGSILPVAVGAEEASVLEKALRGALYGTSTGQNPVATALMASGPEFTANRIRKPLAQMGRQRELAELQDQVDPTERQLTDDEKQLQAVKNEMLTQFGQGTVPSLQRSINLAEEEKEGLTPSLAIPEEDLTNRLPGAKGENLIKDATQRVENTKNEIKSYLGEGKEHDVKFAEILRKKLDKNKNEIGSLYDQSEKLLKDEKVVLSNPRSAKEILDEINIVSKNLKKGWRAPELNELGAELDNLGKSKEVSASQYMSTFRTVDKLAKLTRSKAYERGNSKEAFDSYMKEADNLSDQAEKMRTVLDEGITGDALSLVKQANKRWATERAPLYKNPIFRDVENKERVDNSDIMQELRGKASGNDIINNEVMKDPELLKSVLGQRFAKNPEKLLDPSERTDRYASQLPDLQNKMSLLSKELQGVDKAKTKTEELKTESKRIEAGYKESVAKQEKRTKAIADHKNLTTKIASQTKGLERLQQMIDKKELSKDQREVLKGKIKKKKEEISKNRSSLGKLGAYLLRSLGYHAIGKMFFY